MQGHVRSTNETFGLEMKGSRAFLIDELIPWFDAEFNIHDIVNEFWGIEAKARLVAVTKNIQDKAWKGLVAEWDAGTNLQGQFRINKTLIESLLKHGLGDRGMPFKLKDVTQLEVSIFENFFVELENFWKDHWRVTIPNSNGSFIYLIWGIEIDDKTIGSLAIGVPPGIGPKMVKTNHPYNFKEIAASLPIKVPLDLTVGKTKVKISDLKYLETGDLVVFEESSTDYLTWRKNDLDSMDINITIPGKDNPRFPNLYYDEEVAEMAEEESMGNDDLLTDLPVELTAQFKSVHMPLNQIIELESGGILPLGLLMDSQLTLVAPGDKPIASGNLVIVGNQFGIKIDKTNIKKPVTASLNEAAVAEPVQALPPPQQQFAQEAGFQEQVAEMPQQQMAEQGAESFSDEDLENELEDIGIDPKELDELEDLY